MTTKTDRHIPITVLIVEDEAAACELFAVLLQGEGYTVFTAENGKAALQALQTRSVDIVLLDIMMPEMDGSEFLRIVRADPAFQDLYVIINSARNSLEDNVRMYELGADDYLTKPFSPAELQTRVRAGASLLRLQEKARSSGLKSAAHNK